MYKKLLFAAGLLFSLLLVLYPFIGKKYYEKRTAQVLTELKKEQKSFENEEEWDKCRDYNVRLRAEENRFEDGLSAELLEEYRQLLQMDENGCMGYIRIPEIRITAPIYHGTASPVLDKGIGHVELSSIPVGGESVHTALAAHSGSADRVLFTDLELLAEGDLFYLHILDQVLTYRICEIQTVLPYETEVIREREGEDLCTLITCTPYGINTHRLLVTGRREAAVELIPEETQKPTEEVSVRGDSVWAREYRSALLLGAGLSGFMIFVLCFLQKKKKLFTK